MHPLLASDAPAPCFNDAATSVHVFRVALTTPDAVHDSLRATLNDEERGRADRFVDPNDGRRFTASRAALRLILAEYLHCAAVDIEFVYGERGKPALAKSVSNFAFNVSHSGDQALVAIANCETVGVDIEFMRPSVEILKLARRFFCDEEIAELESVPAEQQRIAFFDCWTRKESYMKAVGDGFKIPLKSFRVSLVPGDEPALIDVREKPDEADRWAIKALGVGDDYRASVMCPTPIDAVDVIATSWSETR